MHPGHAPADTKLYTSYLKGKERYLLRPDVVASTPSPYPRPPRGMDGELRQPGREAHVPSLSLIARSVSHAAFSPSKRIIRILGPRISPTTPGLLRRGSVIKSFAVWVNPSAPAAASHRPHSKLLYRAPLGDGRMNVPPGMGESVRAEQRRRGIHVRGGGSGQKGTDELRRRQRAGRRPAQRRRDRFDVRRRQNTAIDKNSRDVEQNRPEALSESKDKKSR
ncbi:hypothetical protein CKAH01_11064 [Colletotrichum kahawae]|uniref:Uncharacterized protein n=1 Tax=Colletotrichum kahawae TaxID=34407 RepID=A0AAD9XVY1_COLKA|nr:hypothetical protein CKAH01_11064 [Colletotrichum kahawae]